VRAHQEAGKDWQRKAVMETTGFGLGAAAGAFTGSAIISSTVGIALMATPVGWVFVIGTGITAGYFAAKGGDILGKGLSGVVYDRNMSWKSFNGK